MPGSYDKEDAVRCQAEFRTVNTNELVDPDTVIFKFKDPNGTIITYTYGVDSELVKDSVGIYYVDIDIDSDGIWFYRFEGSGNHQAAGEAKFSIKQSEF